MNILKSKLFVLIALCSGFLHSAYAASCTAEADIKPNCCVGPSLCPTGPMIEKDSCHWDYGMWNIEIGFLLEQARLTGTQVAYSEEPFPALPFSEVKTRVIRPSFNLDWGVTASLGWFFDNNQWYILARFDWLESTATRTRQAGPNAAILPINPIRPITPFWEGDLFRNKLKINYYMLDVMLLTGSYLNGCFSVIHHVGVKTAWFYYRGSMAFNGSEGIIILGVERDIHTNSWGVGPELGIDMDWHLTDIWSVGVSFYGESGFALLFGQSKPQERRDVLSTDRHLGTVLDVFSSESRDVCMPTARLDLGFKFSSCFCENRYYVYLKVAFDSVFYWNQYDHIESIMVVEDKEISGEALFSKPNIQYGYDPIASDNNTYSLMGLKVVAGWMF